MGFHPAAQILTWCMLIVALQVLVPGALLAASGSILLGAFLVSGRRFFLLLRRTRWVMLSLLMIYAYSTPGQALFYDLGMLSPTREGLADGVLQLTRLLASLAALAILLEHLHRDRLISGLYTLFTPLQWLGMSRERMAVRLALTLQYAEVTMLRGSSDWPATLRGLLARHDEPRREMSLLIYGFGIHDALLLIVTMVAIWMML